MIPPAPPPAPAESAESTESATSRATAPQFPDGRLEVTGTIGWIRFGRAIALNNTAFFGAELTHHFLFPHRYFSLGVAVATEGGFTGVTGTTNGGVDVVLASVGTILGLRRWRRVMPFVGAGGGFIVVDGESTGLDVTARLAFHVSAGVRFFATNWLVLRVGTKMFIHDNVQFGGGSGQFGDVRHWAFTTGIGIIR